MTSVKETVKSDLCVSCGACITACSRGAIEYEFKNGLYIPKIDVGKCSECGLCLKVCPSAKIDAQATYSNHNGIDGDIKCFSGYSKDSNIRQHSTSGGIVTTLVSRLFELGLYQNAYLLDYDNFNGQAKLKKHNNRDNLLSTSKSKYIPASVESVIADIRNNATGNAIVVCTPCQLLAIRRTAGLLKKDLSHILFIGLFCDSTLNYNIYRYFEFKYGKYDSLRFRDKDAGGWPGNLSISQNGQTKYINRNARITVKPYFQLNRCRYCFDKLNMLADISVGDCYMPGHEDTLGESNIIVWTENGEKAIDACSDILQLNPVSIEDVSSSQKLHQKQENICRNIHNTGPFSNINYFIQGSHDFSPDDASSYKKIRLGAKCNTRIAYLKLLILKKMHNSTKFQKFVQICRRLLHIIYYPDNGYYVYIDNDGYENRGDQLMIDSIAKEIKRHKPDATIVISPRTFSFSQTYCFENKFLPLQLDRDRITLKVFRYIHRNLLGINDFITPKQIDLVLNAKGYAYGDKWENQETAIARDRHFYSQFRKRGRKIYVLPQALGPFQTAAAAKRFNYIYTISTAVYARDKMSYGYAKSVVEDTSKLRLAPDFTITSVQNSTPTISLPCKSYIVVIPNARMIDKTDTEIAEQYLNLLSQIIDYLTQKKENVILLNHEGEGDEHLMGMINDILKVKVPIITRLDALNVKYLIGNSKLTISSRFHGVVSALLQNVPVLCTSWSHKYEELLEDFGYQGKIIDVRKFNDAIDEVTDAVNFPAKYTANPDELCKIKDNIEKMWQEILKR